MRVQIRAWMAQQTTTQQQNKKIEQRQDKLHKVVVGVVGATVGTYLGSASIGRIEHTPMENTISSIEISPRTFAPVAASNTNWNIE